MDNTVPMDQSCEDAGKPADNAAPPVGYRSGESTQRRRVGQRADVPENRWPVLTAVITAIFLQRAIPLEYTVLLRWPLILLEGLLLVMLALINPVPETKSARLRTAATLIGLGAIAVAAHWPLIAAGMVALVLTAIIPIQLLRFSAVGSAATLVLLAAITLDNTASALVLNYRIVTGQVSNNAAVLLGGGAAVFVTNVIVFGIWYWTIDLGGPLGRAGTDTRDPASRYPDFLFPQSEKPALAPPGWQPEFPDYLYLSFTNVVAFSPTDTMPLTSRAKGLMAVQSVVALSTLVLVIARAVNVLR